MPPMPPSSGIASAGPSVSMAARTGPSGPAATSDDGAGSGEVEGDAKVVADGVGSGGGSLESIDAVGGDDALGAAEPTVDSLGLGLGLGGAVAVGPGAAVGLALGFVVARGVGVGAGAPVPTAMLITFGGAGYFELTGNTVPVSFTVDPGEAVTTVSNLSTAVLFNETPLSR